MATGFCPAVLLHIDQVAGGNAPGRKLHIAGFLSMLFCCQNSSVSPLNTESFEGSQTRPLTVKYKQRPTLSQVQTEDDCDINRIPAYAEWNLPALQHAQHSFYISEATMQQYCIDAVRARTIGQPPSQVMQEIYEEIVSSANIVMKYINRDLVGEMATQFGENTTTGSSNGKYININSGSTGMILDNGLISLARDMWENEICDQPCFVGGGNWVGLEQARLAACCNSAGLDMSRLGMPLLFADKDTQDLWGANSAGVFAKGSVKFIGRNKFTGPYAGERGTSFMTSFALPVQEFGCNLDDCLRDLRFDLQIKYFDCPTVTTVNGVETTVQRGWQAIVSKEYAMWVQPTNAYASGDTLENTNGTLKYYLSNTTYTGPAYGGLYP